MMPKLYKISQNGLSRHVIRVDNYTQMIFKFSVTKEHHLKKNPDGIHIILKVVLCTERAKH